MKGLVFPTNAEDGSTSVLRYMERKGAPNKPAAKRFSLPSRLERKADFHHQIRRIDGENGRYDGENDRTAKAANFEFLLNRAGRDVIRVIRLWHREGATFSFIEGIKPISSLADGWCQNTEAHCALVDRLKDSMI